MFVECVCICVFPCVYEMHVCGKGIELVWKIDCSDFGWEAVRLPQEGVRCHEFSGVYDFLLLLYQNGMGEHF